MSNHKAKKFYNSLIQLQSELEKTVVTKCQQLIEEIFKAEKQVLLQNIHKLVEDEFVGELLDSSQKQLNPQSQNGNKFRCDSCNKNFSSTNIGQITITPTDNGMTFENSDYYNNDGECRDPFLESDNYEGQDHDQSSSDMPDIKPIVEILQYEPNEALSSNPQGENSSSLSITSNGVGDDEPLVNFLKTPVANMGNFEILNVLSTAETPTSSSSLRNNSIVPQPRFPPGKIKMRPFKSLVDKRNPTSLCTSEDRFKRMMTLCKRNPNLNHKQRATGIVGSPSVRVDSVGIVPRVSPRGNYACPLCNYVFNNSGKLERHLRSHTGEKPFACTYCSKRFGGKSNLLSHLRNHTGETPYECSQCHVKFKFSYSLTHHMKRYH